MFYGASLVLESKTSYRLYFSVTDQSKLDALNADYGTKDGLIYFETANLPAADVLKNHTIQIGDYTVTANAGQYISDVLSGTNATLTNVVKALYWYSIAAETYFSAQ